MWVIAETDDLATHFTKIVVTDDAGRFLLPELPAATYEVWVRGYGLADSARVEGRPGDDLQLTARVAADAAEAARVYPANYWYSLIEPPASDEFPGTGAEGNGISRGLQVQGQWLDVQKQGCMLCHQLGTRIVRENDNIDQFASSFAAWDPPGPDGAAGWADEQRHEPIRAPARPPDVRRVEQSHRGRRRSTRPRPAPWASSATS